MPLSSALLITGWKSIWRRCTVDLTGVCSVPHNGTNRFIVWVVIFPSSAQLMDQTFHRHSSVGPNRSGLLKSHCSFTQWSQAGDQIRLAMYDCPQLVIMFKVDVHGGAECLNTSGKLKASKRMSESNLFFSLLLLLPFLAKDSTQLPHLPWHEERLLRAPRLQCWHHVWQGIKRSNSCSNWSPRTDTTPWQMRHYACPVEMVCLLSRKWLWVVAFTSFQH